MQGGAGELRLLPLGGGLGEAGGGERRLPPGEQRGVALAQGEQLDLPLPRLHRPLLPPLPLRHLVRVRVGLRVEVRVEVRVEARVAARARLARPRVVVRAHRL